MIKRELKEILEYIEALLEERLLGIDESLPDEMEAIKEYEANKERQGRLIRLDNILGKKDD